MPDDTESLGSCCGCQTMLRVRTIVMLSQKCPIPGHGWACLECGLSADGANAVLCDACCEQAEREGLEKVLRFACRGYPRTEGRIPIGELQGEHRHDLRHHPEAVEGDPG